MKRISYVGGSFVTSDAVADALLHFIASAPRSRRNQVVIVPEFDEQGEASNVTLMIGPASQLMSTHEQVSYKEPDTGTVVEQVLSQARSHEDTAQIDTTTLPLRFDDDAF